MLKKIPFEAIKESKGEFAECIKAGHRVVSNLEVPHYNYTVRCLSCGKTKDYSEVTDEKY